MHNQEFQFEEGTSMKFYMVTQSDLLNFRILKGGDTLQGIKVDQDGKVEKTVLMDSQIIYFNSFFIQNDLVWCDVANNNGTDSIFIGPNFNVL